MVNKAFWKGKRVFLTGHTGFKGAWLSLWLTSMGAKVTGYALLPPTNPNFFELAGLEQLMASHIGCITDAKNLKGVLTASNPDIVIHMAAQPIVGDSYKDPVGTFQTNVIGTVNVLEAVRTVVKEGSNIRALVNVTTDKCYQNMEWYWGYRENEPLGGNDPYSASKACSELVTNAYRYSFFKDNQKNGPGVSIASARAGNVIGGGDWSPERLIPQCVDALINMKPITLRRPKSVRPWQHVLEPLAGYLILAEKLYEEGEMYSQAWNFGPDYKDCQDVRLVVNRLIGLWGGDITINEDVESMYAESNLLMLDCSKAKSVLGWNPLWDLEQALKLIIDWTRAFKNKQDMREVSLNQINEYMSAINKRKSSDE